MDKEIKKSSSVWMQDWQKEINDLQLEIDLLDHKLKTLKKRIEDENSEKVVLNPRITNNVLDG